MNHFNLYVNEQLSHIIVDDQLAAEVMNKIRNYENEGIVKHIGSGSFGIWYAHRKFKVAAALLCMLVMTFTFIRPLNVMAENLATYCYYVIVNGQEIQMATDGINITDHASHENQNYRTLEGIENDLKIHLLKSPMAYEESDASNKYIPQVSDDGVLYGIRIQNNGYVTGDLTNVSVHKNADSDFYRYTFNRGKIYTSPIGCQIQILSTDASKYDIDNKELYSGGRYQLLGPMAENAEVYVSQNLGCQVLLLTTKTDGPMAWAGNGVIDGETAFEETTAELVYDNITYLYYGFVSKDTMKQMIEGLQY